MDEVGSAGRTPIVLSANLAWNLVNFRAPLIRALIADGYRVIAVSPADEHVARLRDMGCEWCEMPMDNKGTSPAADSKLFLRYLALLREIRPAAFLGYTIKPNVYGVLAARMLGIPTFPNVSGLGTAFIKENWVTRVVHRLYRTAFAGATRIFFQNPEDRALFETLGLAPRDRTTTIPGSGIDLAHFAPRVRPAREEAEIVFLLIARLLRDKGVGEYVEAARMLRANNPNARFLLAGPLGVDNRTAISREEVDKWVAEGTIEYCGALADVRDQIVACDVVVLPSYREGAPRTLIEAAAMARATVATDVPGCRHVVENGVTGLLCKVRDSADLARAMQDMIGRGRAGCDAMGQAGRALMARDFDEKLVVEAYRKALADAGVRPVKSGAA